MYKQLYTITLAGLIGVSAIAHGAEITPKAPVETVKAAEASTFAKATADTAEPAKKEFLVPFNQNLYKQYCQAHQGRYESSRDSKFIMLAVASVIIGLQTYAMITYPYSATFGTAKTVVANWWKISAYNKLVELASTDTVWTSLGIAWKAFNIYTFTGFVKNSVHNLTTLSTDMENVNLWEERELLPDTQKQALWHEQIYALFGSPEIVGVVPVTGKYKLRGYKNYSLGQAIFGPFEFDPFDLEQVKTLLGLGTTRQDLRCSKIEIIVL
jgi:hypothetical protein